MSALIHLANGAGAAFTTLAARMLVQSSLLIVVLMVLDLALRRRVRAVVRYWIWLLILVKLLLPPSLSSPMGLAYWVREAQPRVPQPAEVVRMEPKATALPAVRMIARPPMRNAGAAHADAGSPALGAVVNADQAGARPAPATTRMPLPSLTWQGIMMLTWLVVVVMMTALLIQRMLFVRGLMRQSDSAPPEMGDLLRQCCRQMRLRQDLSRPAEVF